MCGNSISAHNILKLLSQFQLKLKARLLNPFPLLTSGTGPCSGISARFCLSKPSVVGSVLPLRPSSRAVGGTSSLGCTLEDGVLMPQIPKNSRCCCGFRPYKTAFYATPCGRILVFERIGNVKPSMQQHLRAKQSNIKWQLSSNQQRLALKSQHVTIKHDAKQATNNISGSCGFGRVRW